MSKPFVGIDVSKAYLDVFIRPTEERGRVANFDRPPAFAQQSNRDDPIADVDRA